MSICNGCYRESLSELISFGMHSISNRFLVTVDEVEFKHPFTLGFCRYCGLVQQINPSDSLDLVPRFEWIQYNEPEKHLDSFLKKLIGLAGITCESHFIGLSHHDSSLLERLKQKGFSNTYQLEKHQDLEITIPFAGIETIQYVLSTNLGYQLLQKKGAFQVIIARSILEHTHDIYHFLKALYQLLQVDGYVVFEVPDCSRAFECGDYTMLWDEHICYFTPVTLKNCLRMAGFEFELLESYQTSTMDFMIIVAKKSANLKLPFLQKINNEELIYEIQRSSAYRAFYIEKINNYRKFLLYHLQKGPIALLGAGHIAFSFLSIMGLGDLVIYVLDDHAHKKGLYFPGTRQLIVSTDILNHGQIKLCLLSVSSVNEEKVIKRNSEFISCGGKFYSIIPTSRYALPLDNKLGEEIFYEDKFI